MNENALSEFSDVSCFEVPNTARDYRCCEKGQKFLPLQSQDRQKTDYYCYWTDPRQASRAYKLETLDEIEGYNESRAIIRFCRAIAIVVMFIASMALIFALIGTLGILVVVALPWVMYTITICCVVFIILLFYIINHISIAEHKILRDAESEGLNG